MRERGRCQRSGEITGSAPLTRETGRFYELQAESDRPLQSGTFPPKSPEVKFSSAITTMMHTSVIVVD